VSCLHLYQFEKLISFLLKIHFIKQSMYWNSQRLFFSTKIFSQFTLK